MHKRGEAWRSFRLLPVGSKPIHVALAILLNWWDYPISTGPLEGTNNKNKTLQRQAYGYRDREFFELKIFTIPQKRYELAG